MCRLTTVATAALWISASAEVSPKANTVQNGRDRLNALSAKTASGNATQLQAV